MRDVRAVSLKPASPEAHSAGMGPDAMLLRLVCPTQHRAPSVPLYPAPQLVCGALRPWCLGWRNSVTELPCSLGPQGKIPQVSSGYRCLIGATLYSGVPGKTPSNTDGSIPGVLGTGDPVVPAGPCVYKICSAPAPESSPRLCC